MALDTAKSLTSTVSEAIKNRYYDELFLRIAEANLVHKQLGQLNRKIPQGSGGYSGSVATVYWTKWTNLDLITAGQGEGYPTTAVSMTATNVTGATAQYDNAVSISDLLAYTSFGDVMKAAVERLAYNAGLSIDTVIRNTISKSGTHIGAVTRAAFTSTPATATFGITAVRKSSRLLSRNDAQKVGGSWIAVIHPDAVYDLQGDTTTGGWIDANKYTSPNANKLMTGEIGKLMGTRFLETSNAFVVGSGVTASSSVYVTSVMGSDAFGVTELQGLKTYIKDYSSGGTGDPTEKIATAGWKTTFGAASLNSDFYVNYQHTVSSTA